MFLSPLRALTTILSCFCFTCNEQFFPTKWHWERCGWSSWPRKDKFFHYKSYLVLRLREIVLEVFNLCLWCLFLSIKLMRQPTWSTHKRGLIFECEREMKFFPTGMKMNQQNDLAMKKKKKNKSNYQFKCVKSVVSQRQVPFASTPVPFASTPQTLSRLIWTRLMHFQESLV